MLDCRFQRVLFHVAFPMSGRFCCCWGDIFHSLMASQRRSLMMMMMIQFRFPKIPLSTQSTGPLTTTQCPAFHPGSSSDAATWQLLLRLHTGLAHLRHRYFVSSYSHNKPTETPLNIRKQHCPTSCNTVRLYHNHVDLYPCQINQPE